MHLLVNRRAVKCDKEEKKIKLLLERMNNLNCLHLSRSKHKWKASHAFSPQKRFSMKIDINFLECSTVICFQNFTLIKMGSINCMSGFCTALFVFKLSFEMILFFRCYSCRVSSLSRVHKL